MSFSLITLDSNQLTGSIPAELEDLSNLRELYLNSNQLTGGIPSELGNLYSLIHLILDHNRLTGTIPSQLEEWGSGRSTARLALGGEFPSCTLSVRAVGY
ncbi:MAG: hypothetical protein KJP23_00870 [Deltaproteobacteria bacterium]|nr:hypothetical protein [Deltaproteobacteria bacterium]